MANGTPELRLRPGDPGEAEALTRLAFASKRLWGYDDDFMTRTAADLIVTPEMIAERPTTVCERGDRLAGFSMLLVDGAEAEVELFFVAPDLVRAGVGCALWQRLVADARVRGIATLRVTADPNAAGFYRAMGAVPCGELESSYIPGRFLPRLAFSVGPADSPGERETANAARPRP